MVKIAKEHQQEVLNIVRSVLLGVRTEEDLKRCNCLICREALTMLRR